MVEINHCNQCPNWYVTKKRFLSGYHYITMCNKYKKQLYYTYGDENRTPHPCKECLKCFSYVPFIDLEDKIKNKGSKTSIVTKVCSIDLNRL